MNRKDTCILLNREDMPNHLMVDMLDLAYLDGVSRTISGVYVTYDDSQEFGIFKPGHDQTLKFRPHDIVRMAGGRLASVTGYTSFAGHMVALKCADNRQYSAHEETLTLA